MSHGDANRRPPRPCTRDWAANHEDRSVARFVWCTAKLVELSQHSQHDSQHRPLLRRRGYEVWSTEEPRAEQLSRKEPAQQRGHGEPLAGCNRRLTARLTLPGPVALPCRQWVWLVAPAPCVQHSTCSVAQHRLVSEAAAHAAMQHAYVSEMSDLSGWSGAGRARLVSSCGQRVYTNLRSVGRPSALGALTITWWRYLQCMYGIPTSTTWPQRAAGRCAAYSEL